MDLVGSEKLFRAQSLYPTMSDFFSAWHLIMSRGYFPSLEALQQTFGAITLFEQRYCFKLPESRLLINAWINFESQVILIDQIIPGNAEYFTKP